MKGILQDDPNNQEDYQPVSNDPVLRRSYSQVDFLRPGETVAPGGEAQTLWLIAGTLLVYYLLKKKK